VTFVRQPIGITGVEERDQVDPCVLRSSLQCGDQWREVTEVFNAIVWMGEGGEMDEVAFQMRIMPSG
jgi:hypothetical protein